MQNELAIKSEDDIRNKIYYIRGKEVMLDSDLAIIYKCTNGTKDINKAVKRHLNKFPIDFYFQLTKEEYEILRFQIGTSSLEENYGGIRYIPHVFTEEGVAMLASVLHTKIADEVSVNIMRAFVAMKHYLTNNDKIQNKLFDMQNKITHIDNKLIDYDSKFEEIFSVFNSNNYLKSKLIFENNIYDAYSFLIDILKEANTEIIIIDNYCDKEILDLIGNLEVPVVVISKNMNDELIKKYQEQYSNLTIVRNDSFHDRFIVIDKSKVYHLGSSLKDLGKKCSYISLMDNDEDISKLIGRVNENI
jgi:hypothetical protein